MSNNYTYSHILNNWILIPSYKILKLMNNNSESLNHNQMVYKLY